VKFNHWIFGLFIIGVILVSGCSPEEIVEEHPQEIAAPIIEEEKEESKVSELPKDSPSSETEGINELYRQFSDFERGDIDFWIERGESIGPDIYQRHEERLNSFESQGVAPEDIERVREKLELLDPGRGYIISQLPECANQMFSVSPVDINAIENIPPLGDVDYAGHILPSDHLGTRIREDFSGNALPFIAPGEMYVIAISTSNPNFEPEYEIEFGLCKDVFGFFSHLKTLSNEMKLLVDDVPCKESVGPSGGCYKELSPIHKVDAGTLLGEIGRELGGSDPGIYFDFGTYDYRKPLP